MHCHASLWEGRNDNARNVFLPHRADGSLDPDARLSPIGIVLLLATWVSRAA
jgi:hypothetical protein